MSSPVVRVRREPPTFRRVAVQRVERPTPRLVRVTLGGPELEGFTVPEPAASVRLLLPSPGSEALVMPVWNGNEFLQPDGQRPTIRTLTPLRADPGTLELDVEIVLHGHGALSEWAESCAPGRPVAMSGPGRGYTIDPDAPAFLLAGDETAIPAIHQLLEVLPREVPVHVCIEVGHPDARLALPERADLTVEWVELPPGGSPGDAFVAAVRDTAIEPDARVWAAGEAAAVQRLRRHFFEERGVPRSHATIRGYWKRGRTEDES